MTGLIESISARSDQQQLAQQVVESACREGWSWSPRLDVDRIDQAGARERAGGGGDPSALVTRPVIWLGSTAATPATAPNGPVEVEVPRDCAAGLQRRDPGGRGGTVHRVRPGLEAPIPRSSKLWTNAWSAFVPFLDTGYVEDRTHPPVTADAGQSRQTLRDRRACQSRCANERGPILSPGDSEGITR